MKLALLISLSGAIISLASAAVLPTADHAADIHHLESRATRPGKSPVKPQPPAKKPQTPAKKPQTPVKKPPPPGDKGPQRPTTPTKPAPAPGKPPKTCKQIALQREQEELDDEDTTPPSSSRSAVIKRAKPKGSNTKNPCNVEGFISGAFESFGKEKEQNPTAPVYGYKFPDSCTNLQWHKGDTSPATKATIRAYETEHVLEWQTVEEFFGAYLAKHFANTKFDSPDPIDVTGSSRTTVKWCDAFKKAWEFKSTDKFSLKQNGPEKTPFQWIADVYPSKTQWRNEFTLLQKGSNSVKGRLFNDDRIFVDEDKGKNKIGMVTAVANEPRLAIARLRDVIGARKYLGDAKVRKFMADVKTRLEDRFDKLEEALAKAGNTRNIAPPRGDKSGPRKIDPWKKQDLGKLWDVFMNNKWVNAKNKQQKFMEKWIMQLKTKHCTAAKIKTFPKDKTKDTPQQKENRLTCEEYQAMVAAWKDAQNSPFTAPWTAVRNPAGDRHTPPKKTP